MKTLAATVRDSGEGERRWFSGGGAHTWLATAEETGGAFLLFEFAGDQGKVTPIHIHPTSDETFYILAGELTFQLGWHVDSNGAVKAGIINVQRLNQPTCSCEARFLRLGTVCPKERERLEDRLS